MEGRSIPQVLRTLPDRLSQRSRLEDMNDEEKDLAHISNEVRVMPRQPPALKSAPILSGKNGRTAHDSWSQTT